MVYIHLFSPQCKYIYIEGGIKKKVLFYRQINTWPLYVLITVISRIVPARNTSYRKKNLNAIINQPMWGLWL